MIYKSKVRRFPSPKSCIAQATRSLAPANINQDNTPLGL